MLKPKRQPEPGGSRPQSSNNRAGNATVTLSSIAGRLLLPTICRTTMRLTNNKRLILEALSSPDYLEWGPPPRSAATIATIIGKCHRQVARTLRLMERQGLVISEKQAVQVWVEIGRPGHRDKTLRCYWNAGRLEHDRLAAAEWKRGSRARSEIALDKLLALDRRDPA